ncbi:unnamed protein product, partial [Sphacelaria rigidula]
HDFRSTTLRARLTQTNKISTRTPVSRQLYQELPAFTGSYCCLYCIIRSFDVRDQLKQTHQHVGCSDAEPATGMATEGCSPRAHDFLPANRRELARRRPTAARLCYTCTR